MVRLFALAVTSSVSIIYIVVTSSICVPKFANTLTLEMCHSLLATF